MNPLELPGGTFLFLFIALLSLWIIVVRFFRTHCGDLPNAIGSVTDVYSLALLRGGKREAIRIAVYSLTMRKLLVTDGPGFISVADARKMTTDFVDERVILACTRTKLGWYILKDSMVLHSLDARLADLEHHGLAPDYTVRIRLRLIAIIPFVLIEGLGICKYAHAAAAGHHNLFFLGAMLLMALGLCIYFVVVAPPSTVQGREVINRTQVLFSNLKNHSVARRADESVFLSAVFGINALPRAEQQRLKRAFEYPKNSNGTTGCSSCGSSSGSSGDSGSSGSGGCGSGGGCGGCGS